MATGKFGRYEIIAELGRGGMATVFHARDPRFERDVAVKVLPREFLHDPTFRARFEREAKIIAALEHPAIVPVYDFGEEGGQPYLVMRYMPGGSLTERLQHGPVPIAEAAAILKRIGSALDEAHQRGIVHRDLKPGNILFDGRGDAFLSDFGIVKLTEETATITGGAIIGTPAYMSPEQAKGESDLDGRSDIYALGALLFEMLTGKLPYESDTPMGQAMQHIIEPVPRILQVKPDLPHGCEALIARAMAKARVERYATAGELETALTAVLEGAPQPAASGAATVLEIPTRPPQPETSAQPRQVAEAPAAPMPQRARGRSMPSWLWIVGPLVLVCGCVGAVLALGVLFDGGPRATEIAEDTTATVGDPSATPLPAAAQRTATLVPTGTRLPVDFLRYGQTLRDQITTAEGDTWRFQGAAGDVIAITMESDELDAYLELSGPHGEFVAEDDDGGEGTHARLYAVLTAAGTYSIVARSFSDEVGAYRLDLQLVDTLSRDELASSVKSIGYGETLSDFVTTDDGDTWTFEGVAGEVVIVAMDSSGLDAYLELYDPEGALLGENDDGGEGTNARIAAILTATGVHSIMARGFGSRTGPYELTLTLADTLSPEDFVSTTGTIAYGQSIDDYITTADGDTWTFAGAAGDVVGVATSGNTDTVLELYGPAGQLVVDDDDSADGSNAELSAALTTAGDYAIVVRGFGGNSGPYGLTLTRTGNVVPSSIIGGPGGAIAYGQTKRDYVTTSKGDAWTFEGRVGDVVTITMNSDALDTYLELYDLAGDLLVENDDGGQGTNARLTTVVATSGRYTVIASGLNGAIGPYELTLTLSAALGPAELVSSDRPIEYNQTVNDYITTEEGDSWRFEGRAGHVVTIAMRSADLDSFLELYGPDGAQLGEDDDSGGDLNSLLEGIVLPGRGTYTIVASSLNGRRGPYELTLTRDN